MGVLKGERGRGATELRKLPSLGMCEGVVHWDRSGSMGGDLGETARLRIAMLSEPILGGRDPGDRIDAATMLEHVDLVRQLLSSPSIADSGLHDWGMEKMTGWVTEKCIVPFRFPRAGRSFAAELLSSELAGRAAGTEDCVGGRGGRIEVVGLCEAIAEAGRAPKWDGV